MGLADHGVAGDSPKLLGDLTGAGVDMDDARVRQALEDQSVEARRQLMEAH